MTALRAGLGVVLVLCSAAAAAQQAGHVHDPGEAAPVPPPTDADRAAARPPTGGHPVHDDAIHSYFLMERLEASDDASGVAWAGQGWAGSDVHRLWMRSEGLRADGRTHAAYVGALYGRGVSAWWDLLAGMRQDFRPGSARTFASVGIQGLAPQWFEVSAMLHAGGHGQAFVELEAQYELLFTNRLILQPTLAAVAWRRGDEARGTGRGLATAEAGLRLRYEFTRRFAPYVGVTWERALGDTADLRRAAAADVHETRLVLGLRTWF